MTPPDPLHAAGVELVDALSEEGVLLRLLGGAAVFEHCPAALADGPYRRLGDLDAMTTRQHVRPLRAALEARGYAPEERVNAMHGDRRLIYHGPVGKLDVFVDTFEMCHAIELRDRLDLEPWTLTASDLLLTKLQVVELTDKDAQDLRALLAEHELASGPGDHVDVGYLAALLGRNWPLWRTATGTLSRLAELEPSVAGPAQALLDAFERTPKSRGFRMRARVGERVRWYELPDEIE